MGQRGPQGVIGQEAFERAGDVVIIPGVDEERAAGSAISRILPKFEVMTGVPLAMDSATGSPNPSLNEGKSVQ